MAITYTSSHSAYMGGRVSMNINAIASIDVGDNIGGKVDVTIHARMTENELRSLQADLSSSVPFRYIGGQQDDMRDAWWPYQL